MIPTVDFDAPGKQHGFLRLPHSRDDSAWGHVMIPICVVSGGQGPTALFIGGTHGDEYEGPIAIRELAATLRPEDVSGRVILLPTLNEPAFAAGLRCSPIDGGNLNRVFPGDARGTVTERIAAFANDSLIPMSDIVCDIHTGGRTLDFLPFAASHILADAEQDARCAAAARAFGAPYTLRMLEIDDSGMLDGAVERAGKTFVTTELGGAGMARASTTAIAKRGLRNLLIQKEIVEGDLIETPTQQLDMPGDDCFHFAESFGLFDPLVDLGATLKRGDALARIWPHGRTDVAAETLIAKRDGLFLGRHVSGLIKPGDCAAVLASPC